MLCFLYGSSCWTSLYKFQYLKKGQGVPSQWCGLGAISIAFWWMVARRYYQPIFPHLDSCSALIVSKFHLTKSIEHLCLHLIMAQACITHKSDYKKVSRALKWNKSPNILFSWFEIIICMKTRMVLTSQHLHARAAIKYSQWVFIFSHPLCLTLLFLSPLSNFSLVSAHLWFFYKYCQ